MMKRLVPLAAFAVITIGQTVPPCPGGNYYDCLICTKVVLTNWFNCCSTPGPEYCCQYECRQIGCELLGLPCPVFGDGIERNFVARYGPGWHCSDPPGECQP